MRSGTARRGEGEGGTCEESVGRKTILGQTIRRSVRDFQAKNHYGGVCRILGETETIAGRGCEDVTVWFVSCVPSWRIDSDAIPMSLSRNRPSAVYWQKSRSLGNHDGYGCCFGTSNV